MRKEAKNPAFSFPVNDIFKLTTDPTALLQAHQ